MEHLLPETQKLISESKEKRIEAIHQKKWFGYSAVNKLLAKMEDLLNHPKTHRMPNLLIKADTNNGKSFALSRFLKSHQPYEDKHTDEFVIPVVAIEIPPDPDADAIYSLILQQLCIPYRESYKKVVKMKKVFDAFTRFKVKMLVIDELHVLMNSTRLRKAQLLDTLKYIGNRGQIVIVGAGTSEAHTAIVSDGQLANRFEPYLLPQWKLDTNFRRLLATFEKVIPLTLPSNLQSQTLATEIYSMSGGWIGEIDAVISRAAIEAIKNGQEQITLDGLRKLDWMTPEKRRYTGT